MPKRNDNFIKHIPAVQSSAIHEASSTANIAMSDKYQVKRGSGLAQVSNAYANDDSQAATEGIKQEQPDFNGLVTPPASNAGSDNGKEVQPKKPKPPINDARQKRPCLATTAVWPRHNSAAATDSSRTLVEYNKHNDFSSSSGFWVIVALYGHPCTWGTPQGFFECVYEGRPLWRCVSRSLAYIDT